MDAHLAHSISDSSHPGSVRRAAIGLASAIGFTEADIGRVALIATEMATNIVKHAGRGQILMRPLRDGPDALGIELLALDQGPGMSDVTRCSQDGYSTAGSPGTGLGAISRLATAADIYSIPSRGTAMLAHLFVNGREGALRNAPFCVGAVRVACPGEVVCGDDWAVNWGEDCASVMVADGLGHGPQAAQAATEAVRTFESSRGSRVPEMFQRFHGALRTTRGAAISVAEIDLRAAEVRFAGVGNVAGFLAWPGGSRSMMTNNGTVGAQFRPPQVLPYAWTSGTALVLHTDGLKSQASVDAYPGLLARHPSLVAAVLFRDFLRGRDDVTVVVVTQRREPS